MTTSATRPNILFIMTDQQRFDAVSAHGGPVKTPNLDRLAANGVDLQQHFAQAPVCVPSRCSLFSGRYPHAHRVLENDARLAPHEVHLFRALKSAGYHLSYAGKNHLLPENEMEANFDRYDNTSSAEGVSEARKQYLQLEKASLKRLVTIGSYASSEFHDFPDEVTTTGIIANETLSTLDNAPDDKPWCCVASFYDPHVPHLAPRRFSADYPQDEMVIPESSTDEFRSKAPRVAIKYQAQGSDLPSDAEKRHYLSVYSAMCTYVDEQIGRIIKRLEERADASRTVVVFVSDHGDFGWHHGLCKKDLLLYDDLLRVPAIIHWPKEIAPQTVTSTFSEHVDIVPTLLDLADVPIPFGCQGRSLVPLLRQQEQVHRDEIHAEVCYPWMRCGFPDYKSFREAWVKANAAGEPMGHSAPFNVPGDYTKCLRDRDWKYIWYGDGFEELYDVRRDPAEATNLAADPKYKETLTRLRQRLFEWVAETADPRSPRTESEQQRAYSEWNADTKSSS